MSNSGVRMKTVEQMTNAELAACIMSAKLAPAKYCELKDLHVHETAIGEAARRLRAQKNRCRTRRSSADATAPTTGSCPARCRTAGHRHGSTGTARATTSSNARNAATA